MWLAQMLRLESYSFFDRLLQGETLDKEVGMFYRLTRESKGSKLESKGADKDQSLENLFKEVGVNEPVVVQRLVQLIDATRSRASIHLKYMCELALRPDAITWKEFRSFYAAWAADRSASKISSWIERQATERNVSVDDVEGELFETILRKRQGCLVAAAEAALLQEHDSLINEATILLELVEQDLLGLNELSASRFGKVYGQSASWIGFRRNQSDKELRNREEILLLKLLSSASQALSTELLEVIIPHQWSPDIDDMFALREALRGRCEAIVAPKAAKEAIKFLTRDGGIQSLTERGRFFAVKYCLFSPESPVWKTSLRDKLLELIGSGRENLTIYRMSANSLTYSFRGSRTAWIRSSGRTSRCLSQTKRL